MKEDVFASQHRDVLNAGFKPGQGKFIPRWRCQNQIKIISFGSEKTVGAPVPAVISAKLRIECPDLRPKYALAVHLQPRPDGPDNLSGLLGNAAVATWADIQQDVSAALSRTNKQFDHVHGRLPVVIARMKPPIVVQCHAGLPGPPRIRSGKMLLGSREITRQTIASVENDLRLDRPHHGIHLLRLPASRVKRPPAVIPQNIYRLKYGCQFADSGESLRDENLVGCRILQSRDGVGLIIPVVQTVIESDLQSPDSRSGNNLRYKIPARPSSFRRHILK